MLERLIAIEEKYNELTEKLSRPEILSDIKETLKSFADIREKVAAQEERLRTLESVHKSASEIRKEKIKSNATIITAVVSAISAVIAAIIAAVL